MHRKIGTQARVRDASWEVQKRVVTTDDLPPVPLVATLVSFKWPHIGPSYVPTPSDRIDTIYHLPRYNYTIYSRPYNLDLIVSTWL